MRGLILPDLDCDKTVKRLTDFIKLELSKTGLNRLVLGISGGVDSALVAFLSAKAAGAENLVGVMLPYKTSDPQNEKDAENLIFHLGLKKYRIDITAQIDIYFEQFPDADKNRRGNKMARERMSVLYDISALEKAVVIGTSNKTEIFLGYGTIYGDLACAFNPLGDLYKTHVRSLARHIGVPANIVNKTPSADLFRGQTDEGDFGFSYEDIDRLLFSLVDKGMTPEQCENEGFSRAMVKRVIQLMISNEFKRNSPPVAKLSDYSAGIDFRCPREWDK
ncbi:MAG: NAD+ synthase [Candidatus Zixiibacteriota bacterium]|nr:MAG: NAD+ synthase [candidate division Zixibacteria bacterium]